MSGDRIGEVSGRRAGDRVETELERLGESDGDDAVLEAVRRVGGVVLDPDLADAELLGEPIGADERRQPGLDRAGGA